MTSATRCGSVRWKDIFAIVITTIIILLLATALYFMWTLFRTPHEHIRDVNKLVQREPSASFRDTLHPDSKEQEELQAELPKKVLQTERKLSVAAIADALKRGQAVFFTPVKVSASMPLHEHDLLYGEDELWRARTTPEHPAYPGPDSGKHANLSQRNSGHFRHIDMMFWDPNPQYEFMAFGRLFHLDLKLSDGSFASPKLRAHHVSPNSTFVHVKPMHKNTPLCFYTGRVHGDPKSNVILDLCHGMKGSIYTSKGVYFVEPSEYWPMENATDPASSPSVRHVMYLSSAITPDSGVHHSGEHESHLETEQESHCALPHADTDEDTVQQRSITLGGDRHYAGVDDEEPLNNSLHPTGTYKRHRSKRSLSMGSYSKQLHIDVKVVTDRKMSEYHGTGLFDYVMTLMSTVSLVFKDASIGNHINVNLVDFESRPDILFYTVDSPWYSRSGGNSNNTSDVWATDVLKNFCAWQYRTRFTPDKNRNYDTAVLLTRENLCRYSNLTSCGTLGLAEVGAVCEPSKSCSIVQDNGLSAAFTIAHEIGHVLNMKHDNDPACKRLIEPTGIHYMMAHMPGKKSFPWAWSNCSKQYLTEFLDSGRGHCLEDVPDPLDDEEFNMRNDRSLLPGEYFDPSRQCAMLYDSGAKICSYMPKCGILWCSKDDIDGCISQFVPWADGTPCKHNMWCQKGNCVPMNRAALKPIHGSWSSWGPWGECSRTCGGGIRQARRECDSPLPEQGGRYCIGERVKYESCQTENCPYGARDFREMQCARYNGNGETRWIPKYFGSTTPHDQCKLMCRGQYTEELYQFNDKVIDGTPCSPTTYDVCVNGKCYAAGCDHRLDSTKTLDSCGVCDGDNSTCHVISGTYNVSAPEYQKVVVIPKGSTNIYVRQTSLHWPSPNTGVGDNIHLALRLDGTGNYILNGGYNVRTYQSRIVEAGAPVSYTGAKDRVEILNSTLEPIKVALVLEVFIVGNPVPPNIEYSYTMHYPYIWKVVSEWSECRNCTSIRSLACVEPKTGMTVNKTRCMNTGQKKPEWHKPCIQPGCNGMYSKINKCNDQDKNRKYPCKKYTWVFSNWTKCEASCNSPGFQTRTAKCINHRHRQVLHSNCEPLKAEDLRKYCTKSCAAHWQASDWTPCSVECGYGVQKRPLWCEMDGRKVTERHCSKTQQQPDVRQACYETNGCVGRWYIQASSQCSVTCGEGMIQRQVICIVPAINSQSESDERFCAHLPRPTDTVECSLPSCQEPQTETPSSLGITAKGSRTTSVTGRPTINISDNIIIPSAPRPPVGQHIQVAWFEDSWNECSVSCGIGVQRRNVQCWEISEHQLLDDVICEQLAPRPIVQRKCSQTCLWRPRDWQPCSVSCGIGITYREVECEAEWTRAVLPDSACASHERPNTQGPCEGPPCHTFIADSGDRSWSTGSWGACSVNSKSGCGVGHRRRQVKCLHGVCEGIVPPDTEKCVVPCHDSVWNYGEWGSCTRPCGGGFRYRLVRCQSVNGDFLEEEACVKDEKPTISEECNTHRCIGYRWKTGPWGQCSERCGRGFKNRAVQCVTTTSTTHSGFHAAGQPVEAHFCGGLMKKPSHKRGCYRYQCPYAWQFGEWSECSASCGVGMQQRNVTCHRVSALGWLEGDFAHEEKCYEIEKPASQQHCNLEDCSEPYHWSAGPWSQCSALCGKRGKQKRTIHCLTRDGLPVSNNMCRPEIMPKQRRKCNQRKCPGASTCKEMRLLLRGQGPVRDGLFDLVVQGHNVTLYCHDMTGVHPKEYINLPSGERENYSEFYHLSLKDPSTCPSNGHRWDNCTCVPESKGSSGTTVFTKIRLNVHTMRVKTDDFTFSRTIRGKRQIPYGEAGDCYSHVQCPQGRFSVNLSGTPFRVSNETGWFSNGSMIRRIDEEHQKVWGKCGGMCGSCSPRKETGLKLDLVEARHTRHHLRS